MDHKDPAIKIEMMRSEIEEIKANMKSAQAADLAGMAEELAAREKELAARLAGGAGAADGDDPAITTEMMRNEIDAIRANMESVQARFANLPDGPVRAEFAKDLADMKEELAVREKELAAWLAR